MMKNLSLFKGEFASENAPKALLEDGRSCIPQHYLQYAHTRLTVEELILKIDYSSRYPIFVCQDHTGIYLQVGIIGQDNYSNKAGQAQAKIVYGRKWRVEPNLPSSEIVQTAFLAIKKAREHEVRELFRLRSENKITTPFNNHQDINLLTHSSLLQANDNQKLSWATLQQELNDVSYDQATFFVHHLEQRRSHCWLLELEVIASELTNQPEVKGGVIISLVLTQLTFNEVLHQLMAHLIHLSDQHVDEQFTFSKVARFSRNNSIKAISSISANTRQLHKSISLLDFEQGWKESNYETDLTRVPQLSTSKLSRKIKAQLNSFGELSGALPAL